MERTIAAAVLLALAPFAAGCSDDDEDASVADEPTTTATVTSGATSTSTTIDDGVDPPAVDDPCGALGAALAAAGVEALPAQLVATGEDGCSFTAGSADQGIVLDVRNDVDSSVFESALADSPGDPVTVAGLGEMAVVVDLGTAQHLVVFADRRLVTLEGTGYTPDQLTALAPAVLSGL